MSATIVLESMPPDRNAPSGTSAMHCCATARRNSASSWLDGLCVAAAEGLGKSPGGHVPQRPIELRPRRRSARAENCR